MPMNKVKGNMYPFVTHTWNPIRGKCPHDCKYCYMKKFKVGELRLERKEFHTNLGKGNFIFVGSSTDMFADDVPGEWINKVLDYCRKFNNTYLFQSKNPRRFHSFIFPANSILGTTFESNLDWKLSKAPQPCPRMEELSILDDYEKMISIEPILEFDLEWVVDHVKLVRPKFVSIGADSQGHNLPEPSPEKVKKLIEELEKFTEVKVKPNLNRIMRK